jgi:hypothetical protein
MPHTVYKKKDFIEMKRVSLYPPLLRDNRWRPHTQAYRWSSTPVIDAALLEARKNFSEKIVEKMSHAVADCFQLKKGVTSVKLFCGSCNHRFEYAQLPPVQKTFCINVAEPLENMTFLPPDPYIVNGNLI